MIIGSTSTVREMKDKMTNIELCQYEVNKYSRLVKTCQPTMKKYFKEQLKDAKALLKFHKEKQQ